MIEQVIRPDHEAEDKQAAREALDAELAANEKMLMVIRGGDEVADFANKAGGRADPFGWREAIWIKAAAHVLEDILTGEESQEWFEGHDAACAVVLDGERQVSSRLEPTASKRKIDSAFLTAKS